MMLRLRQHKLGQECHTSTMISTPKVCCHKCALHRSQRLAISENHRKRCTLIGLKSLTAERLSEKVHFSEVVKE